MKVNIMDQQLLDLKSYIIILSVATLLVVLPHIYLSKLDIFFGYIILFS